MGNLNIRFHFKRRLWERYGINISNRGIKDMLKMVGPNTLIRDKSENRKVHRINYKGKEVLVVYDTKRKTLVTALTNEQGEV